MKRLLIILILIFIISCKKDEDGFTEYTVKAGHEYSRHGIGVSYNKKSIQFWFKVNNTWNMEYTGGINKVGGTGWFWNHHENSCRLGVKGNVFYQYGYADGVPYRIAIDTLGVDTYYCNIGRVGDEWHLTLEGITHTCPAGRDYKLGIKLFPNLRNSIDKNWIVPIKWNN